MPETHDDLKVAPDVTETQKTYVRFNLYDRVQHFVLLISFSILGLTGLVQKFAESPISQGIMYVLGGIETTRVIHHDAAIVLLLVSIYHVIVVLYRIFVRRLPLSMLPVPQDFVHLFHDLQYYFGRRKHKAYYGRYNYAEKAEYLAVVWGTLIMAITGFMMWNPIATTQFFSGEVIPAAKAAHGGEALLAVLAIILWHFYHVHLREFNKSMFTGKLTEEEMKKEHPAELAQIEAGQANRELPAEIKRKREMIFYPVAAVLVIFFGFGLFRFVTLEQTAITTIPIEENATVFVPFTPTPRPTPAPTQAGSTRALTTWDGGIGELFNSRCGTCHVQASFGDLSLATYQDALKGGKSGPAVVSGNPDGSMLVEVQSTGNHPGQLTQDELNAIIQWIRAGAPEK
ncbi:MAG TPA: c-type cytochrome domain-containing protein [Anaerolineales bacterium]